MDKSESLANIVFVRTEKGVNACKTSSKELPRQLKSLLLVVDGKSTVSKFASYLTNLLPLSDKFTELELAGYVHRNHSQTNLSFEQINATSIESDHAVIQISDYRKIDLRVQNVMHEIQNFLALNAGVDATRIMSVLGDIKTLDQLKSELPAYFDLIESYDLDGSGHALALEQMLVQA